MAPVVGHELGAPSPLVGGPVHLRRPRPLGLIRTPAATQMVPVALEGATWPR